MKIFTRQSGYNKLSFRFFPWILFLLLIFGGCRVLKPEKPTEEYTSISYAPRDSYISIPVVADVKTLEKLINREMKGVIYSDTSFADNGGDNLKLMAARSDSIRIAFDKNQLLYSVPLKIWLTKRLTAGLLGLSYSTDQAATAELVLRFKTTININRDWTLSTVTLTNGYDWVSYPQIMAGLMQLPLPVVSDLVVSSNLPMVSRGIDRAIRETVNLRSMMTDTWGRIQKPVLISPENDLWLRLTPREISTVPIRSAGSFINHTVGLTARVELFYGQEPPYTVNPVLPPLKITSALPESFNISVGLDLPFSKINELARKAMTGYTLNYQKYKVTVTGIDLYGKGENLIVAVDLDGSVKGTVYLAGTPACNPDSMTISLSNLDFQVDTRNVIAKTATWMFRAGLIRKLSSSLVFPVGDQLLDARKQLQNWLVHNPSEGAFRIRGEIERLEPDRVLVSPGSVKAYLRFTGKINVALKPD